MKRASPPLQSASMVASLRFLSVGSRLAPCFLAVIARPIFAAFMALLILSSVCVCCTLFVSADVVYSFSRLVALLKQTEPLSFPLT